MTGLLHSPGDILRRALIAAGIGTSPDLAPLQPWPIFHGEEQTAPDNAITVRDTQEGVDSGAVSQVGQGTGEVIQFPSCQVRVRGSDHNTAFRKSMQIKDYFKDVVRLTVVMPSPDVESYLLAWVRARPFGYQGKEKPGSRRQIITINCIVSVRLSD